MRAFALANRAARGQDSRKHGMKLATTAFLAFVAALAFLALFIADREKEAGVERISNYTIPSHATAPEKTPAINVVTTPKR